MKITIQGPQACGKTRTALLLAHVLRFAGKEVTVYDGDDGVLVKDSRGPEDPDVVSIVVLSEGPVHTHVARLPKKARKR